jgi:hypothetical protein
MEFKITKQESSEELVKVDEHLEAIKTNRERLRASASMLQSISGMLLSAGFLILFFLIQEGKTRQEPIVYLLMFSAIISLFISTLISLFSVFVRPPTSVITKSEEFYRQLSIYKSEYRWSATSAVLFVISIILFLAALIVFAVRFG